MKTKIRIFTDFDGTISINDVGDTLFKEFAPPSWADAVQDWKDGKIGSKECLSYCCEITKITREQVDDFCDRQKIDEYFRDFISYCRSKEYPITVLSDGLSYYIERILNKHGFHDLAVIANQLIFLDHNQIKPEFPHYGKGCVNCANCKGYHIEKMRQPDETILFIGDGLSDCCGVKKSDIVFAKDDLKTYCLQNDIEFYEFNNFKDVLEQFKLFEKEK